MNSTDPNAPQPARSTFRRVLFAVALLLLILCALVSAAEQYLGWHPPEFVRQAIKIFRNQ